MKFQIVQISQLLVIHIFNIPLWHHLYGDGYACDNGLRIWSVTSPNLSREC